jgi:hypothetical protein
MNFVVRRHCARQSGDSAKQARMIHAARSVRSPLYDVRKHAEQARVGTACELRCFADLLNTTFSIKHSSCSGTAIAIVEPSGGARRDRTDDLMLAKHALSQLSYGPVPEDECLSRSHRRSGLRSRRPAEPRLQSSEGWWAWEDLNFRPHAYQARALTN